MKVRSSIFDLDMSGKLGNVVGGKARGGINWLRSRVIPINPQTSDQSQRRASLSSLASRWKTTLTQAQRDAWDTYAAAVLKAGLSLTGEQWYVGANALRLMVNDQPLPPLAPALVDAAPINLSRALLSPCSIIAKDDGSLNVTFNNTDPWATAVNGGLIIMSSPITSPSRKFNSQGVRFRTFLEGAAVPPVSGADILAAIPVGAVGQRIFVALRATNADARYSEQQNFSTLIVAA